MPLWHHAEERAPYYIERMSSGHSTELFRRLRSRQHPYISRLADHFQQQIGSLGAIDSAPALHAPRLPLLTHYTIAGIDNKNTAVVVCRAHVSDEIDSAYHGFTHLYRDRLVDRIHGTATPACNKQAFRMRMSGRMYVCTGSTTAVLCAIQLAFQLCLRHSTSS